MHSNSQEGVADGRSDVGAASNSSAVSDRTASQRPVVPSDEAPMMRDIRRIIREELGGTGGPIREDGQLVSRQPVTPVPSELRNLREALGVAPWFVTEGRFSVERIVGAESVNWRIADDDDNRVATCFDHDNANIVAAALNLAFAVLRTASSELPAGDGK